MQLHRMLVGVLAVAAGSVMAYPRTPLGMLSALSDNTPAAQEEVDDIMSFVDMAAEADQEVTLMKPIKALGSIRAAGSLDPGAVEFSKIQYMQAAIAEKKQQVLAQKLAVIKEKEQIKRETKLMKKNAKILALNEEQINQAQELLKNMISNYSKQVDKKFKATAIAAKMAGVKPARRPRRSVKRRRVVKRKAKKGGKRRKVVKRKGKKPAKKAKKVVKRKAAPKKKVVKKAKKTVKKAKKASFLETEDLHELDNTVDALEAFESELE